MNTTTLNPPHGARTGLRPAALTLGLSVLMAGCTLLPDREAPRVMDLPVPQLENRAGAALGLTMQVDTPHATEPFGSSRILARPEPLEYKVYGGVRWRDTGPTLVRELMIGVLRQSGRFDAVINETSPAGSDLTLVSDLYGFHREPAGRGYQAVIRLYAQLLDNRSRETLCSRDFRIAAPAFSDTVEDVAMAFSAGGEALANLLLPWLEACITGANPASETDPARQP